MAASTLDLVLEAQRLAEASKATVTQAEKDLKSATKRLATKQAEAKLAADKYDALKAELEKQLSGKK